MSDATQDLWAVPRGRYWGFVDRSGQMQIPPERFTGAEPFSEGLAAVTLARKKGYIDPTGEIRIEPQFDSAGRFSQGLAPVARGRRKEPCFYIDRSGQQAFAGKFLKAGEYGDGRAVVLRVQPGGGPHLQTWIDGQGRPMLPLLPRQLYPLSEGLAPAVDPGTGRFGYLDPDGEWAISPDYQSAGDFCEGLAVVVVDRPDGEVETFVIDRQAREVWRFPVPYLDVRPYREGLLRVPVDGSDTFARAYVDHEGQVVIPPSRRHWGDFHDGRAVILEADGRHGYIDRTGRVVVSPVLRFASDFDRGLARVGPFQDRPGTHGLIDLDGNWIWPPDAAERGFPDLAP
ncbi:MAG: WG repeat-containing protein [Deltaproteobacteria bacterium]|nr:WG repeat-containing protein [Deltaproteobacteria bacterium]